jgi:hypothetical protein
MLRAFVAGLTLLLWLIAPSVAADDLKIADFYGHFEGSASTSEGATETYLENRGSDVSIQPDPNGFTVSWTTLQVKGDETATAGTNASVKTKELTFKPAGSEGLWLSAANTPTLEPGKAFSWARITGSTLVLMTVILQPNGDYDMTNYERTLKTKDKMELRFTRWKNGEMKRRVSAELDRVAN